MQLREFCSLIWYTEKRADRRNQDAEAGVCVQAVEVPEENLVGVLMANEMEHPLRGAEAVRAAPT